MPTGKVTYWNVERGFGFIRPDEPRNAEPIFAHVSKVDPDFDYDDIPKDTRVSYEIGESKRRPGTLEAKEIKVIS